MKHANATLATETGKIAPFAIEQRTSGSANASERPDIPTKATATTASE